MDAKTKYGTAAVKPLDQHRIGLDIAKRMKSIGFPSFTTDDIKSSVMRDMPTRALVDEILRLTTMTFERCGPAISACLRRVGVVDDVHRLVDLGRVKRDGTPDVGAPCRFAFVPIEAEPPTLVAVPKASPPDDGVRRIEDAIRTAATMIVKAMETLWGPTKP